MASAGAATEAGQGALFDPAGRSGGTKRLKLTTSPIRTGFTLLLASLLASPSLAFPAVSASRRAQAIAAYERGVRMRTTLESQPHSARRKADYEKVVRVFQEVYRLNPAYSKAPAALAAVGELQEEMGRQFSSDRYYLDAVRTYQFLISQYPQHRLAADALYTVGEIYRVDLENAPEARQAFQKFLEKYPKSSKAAEAREKLQQIEPLVAERAASRNVPRRTPEAERSPSAEQTTSAVPQLTAIRRWVGPNYTRIVLTMEGEVKFDASRLANPDRIVFDLANTRPSPTLAGKSFPVEDGYLREIRVAQFRPNVTRVVLDVQKIDDYSVFTLPNPFRLVIDIHGGPAPEAEKASTSKAANAQKPPSSATETARAGTKQPASVTTPAGRQPREKETASERDAPNRLPQPPARGQATKEQARLEPPPSPAAAMPAQPTASGSRTLTRALGLKIRRIVIDPGHGGHDTGTIGPTGLREKDIVLDVAMRVRKLLARTAGSDIVLTRSADVFIPLEERTAIANEKAADLFISVHANASRDRSARGIETYYLNFTSSPDALEVAARENATTQESVHQLQDLIKKIALTEKIEESHEFARQVQRQVQSSLVRAGGEQRDRGVKKAPFVVLIGANMPSILAEISFLTNPRDERLLKRGEYRQRIAEALYQGITRYMNTLGALKVAQQVAAKEPSPTDRPIF